MNNFRSKEYLSRYYYSRTMFKDSNPKTTITVLQALLLIVIYSDCFPMQDSMNKVGFLKKFTYYKNEKGKWYMNKGDYYDFMNICMSSKWENLGGLENLAVQEIMNRVDFDFKKAFQEIILKDGIPTMYKLYRRYDRSEKLYEYKIKYKNSLDVLILNWCGYFVEMVY